MTLDSIYQTWPPVGPTALPSPIAWVTDDTQMALAIADALIEAHAQGPLSPTTIEPAIRTHFIRWYHSPDNTRAPGNTCLQACEALETGISWQDACMKNSKGCGANMRVAPVAMVSDDWFGAGVDSAIATQSSSQATSHPDSISLTHSPQRAALAQLQAGLTHGHATGLAASDLTTYALVQLFNGLSLQELVPSLIDYAHSQRQVYHYEWLGTLWQRPCIDSPTDYISRGWDECLDILKRLSMALKTYDPTHDPCDYTGEGWIAEEAMASGLLCFLTHVDAPQEMLTRAAATRGDSDSIACLAGAFAGAYHDFSIWPDAWAKRIEYADWLHNACQSFTL